MKTGDTLESAVWLTGAEPPEMRAQYESDTVEAIDYFCRQNGFAHGPVEFTEHLPGGVIPPVPDHISGPRVRLLKAEAMVTDTVPATSQGSFTAQLEKSDLRRLRIITRQARLKHSGEYLSNRECDEVIEEIGPEAALATLRRTVH